MNITNTKYKIDLRFWIIMNNGRVEEEIVVTRLYPTKTKSCSPLV